jgi:NAD dependent epimerase/dehydratase family enzyme
VVVETPGDGPEVAAERDALLENAGRAGVQSVLLRTGHVLTPAADPLQSLLRAPWSWHGWAEAQPERLRWISIEDLLGLILTAALSPTVAGRVEAAAPERVSPAVFLEMLRQVVRSPRTEPITTHSDSRQLASDEVVRVVRLEQAGFRYLLPDLEGALRFLLGC